MLIPALFVQESRMTGPSHIRRATYRETARRVELRLTGIAQVLGACFWCNRLLASARSRFVCWCQTEVSERALQQCSGLLDGLLHLLLDRYWA